MVVKKRRPFITAKGLAKKMDESAKSKGTTITKMGTQSIVELCFQEIGISVKSLVRVVIDNYCVFEPRQVSGKGRKNPITQEPMDDKPLRRMWVRVMKEMNRRMNENGGS